MTSDEAGLMDSFIGTSKYVHESPNPEARNLIVILQAYNIKSAQESIRQTCLSLVRETGTRLFTVEGADGPIPVERRFADIGQMLDSAEVSAGVLAAAASSEFSVDVVGVDSTVSLRHGCVSR